MSSTESIPIPPNETPPDGKLDALMRTWFGRSWRTGIASRALYVLGAVNVVVAAVPDLVGPRWVAALGALVTFTAAAGMSAAKDDKVTGVPK